MIELTLSDFAKQVFTKIRLVERYSKLSANYSNFRERLNKIDKKEIVGLLRSYDYKFKYLDRSYYFTEDCNGIIFHTKLRFSGGTADLNINVVQDNNYLDLSGGDIGRINKLILDLETATLVCFTNYEDLKVIIQEYLEIYEDFKKEISQQLG